MPWGIVAGGGFVAMFLGFVFLGPLLTAVAAGVFLVGSIVVAQVTGHLDFDLWQELRDWIKYEMDDDY